MIKNNESIPADVLILKTSNKNGTASIETSNLDGETNLKTKKAQLLYNKLMVLL